MTDAPFPTDPDALTVAYYASAEMGCFRALGWNMPVNLLDLFAEFRCLTNGQHPPHGNGLVGALLYFGLDSISVEEKTEMRDLILSGGPWTADQQKAILDYCETDVVALDKLLTVMQSKIDWPRASLRGAYMQAAAQIEYQGIPLDYELFKSVDSVWSDIQGALIARIDQDFGVFEGRTFKANRWEKYLQAHNIPWPRHPLGTLDLSADTFADMTHHYPAVAPMQQLRAMLAELRLSKLRATHLSRDNL